MKNKIDFTLIFIVLSLGLVHSGMTPVFFKEFNESWMWFFGTGLAFVFAALINFSRIYVPNKLLRNFSLICNLSLVMFLFALVFASNTLEPQMVLSCIVVVLLFIVSLVNKKDFVKMGTNI